MRNPSDSRGSSPGITPRRLSGLIDRRSFVGFTDIQLSQNRPSRVRDIALPRRERYFPSPADWRDETLYFLLPDRFSDGKEQTRPLLDRSDLAAARNSNANGGAWRWDQWAESGAE